MHLHLFQSEKDDALFGLTVDEQGINLPADFSPWNRLYAVETGAAVFPGNSPRPPFDYAGDAIERYGFYLTRNRADAENSGQFTTASNPPSPTRGY
jgi:hypothetical protein